MRKLKTFSLDPAVVEALVSYSRDTDVPQSRVVERALKEYLKLLGGGAPGTSVIASY